MIPDFLRERYALVKERYLLRFPGNTVPALPEGDPNLAVMAIDQMLAPLQDRAPLRITVGDPVLFEDTTPELPAHPAARAAREK